MLKSERKHIILEKVIKERIVSIEDLVQELNSSESTVRRDLDELEAENKLRRIHGGAESLHSLQEEESNKDKAIKNVQEKSAIAKKAAELKKQLSPKIKAVGVFVNAEPEFIAKLYQKQIIDLAQLHGDETADYIHRLKNLCPSLPLIKAVRVQSTKQILEAEKLPCDYLLLDT